jgi:hypothetical protein
MDVHSLSDEGHVHRPITQSSMRPITQSSARPQTRGELRPSTSVFIPLQNPAPWLPARHYMKGMRYQMAAQAAAGIPEVVHPEPTFGGGVAAALQNFDPVHNHETRPSGVLELIEKGEPTEFKGELVCSHQKLRGECKLCFVYKEHNSSRLMGQQKNFEKCLPCCDTTELKINPEGHPPASFDSRRPSQLAALPSTLPYAVRHPYQIPGGHDSVGPVISYSGLPDEAQEEKRFRTHMMDTYPTYPEAVRDSQAALAALANVPKDKIKNTRAEFQYEWLSRLPGAATPLKPESRDFISQTKSDFISRAVRYEPPSHFGDRIYSSTDVANSLVHKGEHSPGDHYVTTHQAMHPRSLPVQPFSPVRRVITPHVITTETRDWVTETKLAFQAPWAPEFGKR